MQKKLLSIIMLSIISTILIGCQLQEKITYESNLYLTNKLVFEQEVLMLIDEITLPILMEHLNPFLQDDFEIYSDEFFQESYLLVYYAEDKYPLSVDQINLEDRNLELSLVEDGDKNMIDAQLLCISVSNEFEFDTINDDTIILGLSYEFVYEKVYAFSTEDFPESNQLNAYFFSTTALFEITDYIIKTYIEYQSYLEQYDYLVPSNNYPIREDDFENYQLIILQDVSNGMTITNLDYTYSNSVITVDITAAPLVSPVTTAYVYYVFVPNHLSIEHAELNLI